MTIESIAALSSAFSMQQVGATPMLTPIGNSAAPGAFDAVVRSLDNISTQMVANQQAVESVAVGQTDDLHRVMINLETTKLSFQLALQVRNKVLEAYQELMRMQV